MNKEVGAVEAYELGRLVLAEQVRLIYENNPYAIVGLGLGIPMFLAVFWGQVAPSVIWALAALHCISHFDGVRGFITYRLIDPRPEQARILGRRFTVRLFFASSILASWGIFLFVPDSPTYQSLLTVMLCIVATASGGAVISYLPAYYAWITPLLLPLSGRMLFEGDLAHVAVGSALLLMEILLLVFGRNTNRLISEALELRFKNIGLVEQLTKKQEELTIYAGDAQTAKEEAERANVEKSRFLAAASHDLRQPLHALGLLTAALRSRILRGEEREILIKIDRSVAAMDGLFNALLDMSKLDAGIIKPNIEVVSIQSLLAKLEPDFTHEAADKGLRLRIAKSRRSVISDAVLLERIVRNLISNAIRYTTTGSVLVCCRRRGSQLLFEVRDSGIGIPETQQQSIFEEFYQLNNPERDRRKGLGLGLAIVKRLSTLLDHPIHVRSWQGKGSTFAIEIPLAQARASVASDRLEEYPDEGDCQIDGAFVLVVDDENDVLQSTKILLEDWGCHVVTAGSGDEAIRKLTEHIRYPDVVISDYRLRNGETGFDVIRKVRARFDAAIPGILITGDFKQISNEALVTGELPVLFKPVPPISLRQALSNALRLGHGEHTAS